jgi:hypothetical protein
MNTREEILDDNDEPTGKFIDGPEEWEVKDRMDYFRDELVHENFYCVDNNAHDNNRSYPGQNLKTWWANKTFADVQIEISITAKVISGYYEGASLDWEVELFMDNCSYDAIDVTDFVNHCNHNKGVAIFTYPKVDKWIETTKQKMIDEMEKIFETFSEVKLQTIAVASNGEAFYKTVN